MEEHQNPDQELLYSEAEMKLSEDFYSQLKFSNETEQVEQEEEEEEEDDDEDGDEKDEFSFVCEVENDSQISAEDAFANGQIKPVFPLFNRDLFFSDEDENILHENLPIRPPVKKVFVERVTSAPSESDDIAGPYCELTTRKVVEASPEVCKKSNSTGFSKIWRLKDFAARCNSDGRDAFVFLNHSRTTAASTAESSKKESTKKVKGNVRAKKSGKTTPLSAHEVYLRNKAKADERQKSYLPYRKELMGIFTNVNGGLTRSMHPF